jgi:hypothetical protein
MAMELLPMALITADRLTRSEVLSARPDAPVVPTVVRAPRLSRSRAGAAMLLTKVAKAIAPAPAPVTASAMAATSPVSLRCDVAC